MNKALYIILAAALASGAANAQTLSLEQCRQAAMESNMDLKAAREDIQAASADLHIARANYYPSISATGLYMFNNSHMDLLGESAADALGGIGTSVQGKLTDFIGTMMANPQMQMALQQDPSVGLILKNLSATDIESGLNAIGTQVADMFSFDLNRIFAGAVSLEQPIYAGGKIRAYNRMAESALELSELKLRTQYEDVLTAVDEAYWQIVSLAAKKKLAESYVSLVGDMSEDVSKLVREGVATRSDELAVKVRLNEAELALTKASNGLVLSKMLLCQLCGWPISQDITLHDEQAGEIAVPQTPVHYPIGDVLERRSDLRSLSLAGDIYSDRIDLARADYLPQVALMGNYIMTNPNIGNGFRKTFDGFWNVGVAVKVPIFHMREGIWQVRKAQAERQKIGYQLDDARQKVALQVSQYEQRIREADSQIAIAEAGSESAEENLRMATVGFREGVIETSVVTQAQTAWLQARSELIDARIQRIMSGVYLMKAAGAMDIDISEDLKGIR